jgi:ethanolamine ammonia-lyase small subunit
MEPPVPVRVEDGAANEQLPALLAEVRARTPARVFAGRAGPSYRTGTQLELRQDHAAAVDAVHAEIEMQTAFGEDLVKRWELFEVSTQARHKAEYLLRPDLGRRFNDAARQEVVRLCPADRDFQVVIGDGLSAAAVAAQVPSLLQLLHDQVEQQGWTWGRPFFVRHCRVGILNEVGDVLGPAVVVLLIGERPGLATAESLSAYLAFAPRAGHTDAQRNLISNIHARGVPPAAAAPRIVALAAAMCRLQTSGVLVKEELPAIQ